MSKKNVSSSLKIAEDCFRQIIEHPATPFELKKAARFGLYEIELFKSGTPEPERMPQRLKDELDTIKTATADRTITAQEAAQLADLANRVVNLEDLPARVYNGFTEGIDEMHNESLVLDIDHAYVYRTLVAHCNDLRLVPTIASENFSVESETDVANALVALLDSPYTPSSIKALLNSAVDKLNAELMSDTPETPRSSAFEN